MLTRVKSLALILDDASVVLPQRRLTDGQRKSLPAMLDGIMQVLKDLSSLLRKYSVIETRPAGLLDKSKRILKRLSYEPEDIKNLRARLTSQVVLLHALNDSITR